jgi:hypothetical protein
MPPAEKANRGRLRIRYTLSDLKDIKGSVQQKLRWVKNMLIVGYKPRTVALDIIFIYLLNLHVVINVFQFPLSGANF